MSKGAIDLRLMILSKLTTTTKITKTTQEKNGMEKVSYTNHIVGCSLLQLNNKSIMILLFDRPDLSCAGSMKLWR